MDEAAAAAVVVVAEALAVVVVALAEAEAEVLEVEVAEGPVFRGRLRRRDHPAEVPHRSIVRAVVLPPPVLLDRLLLPLDLALVLD